MPGSVLMFAATVLIGALALLAQWARKSRGAEVTLFVVLLSLSALISTLGVFTSAGLVLTATAGDAPIPDRVAFVAAGAAAFLAGIVGVGLCIPPLRKLLGSSLRNPWWTDPPVFLALWLFTMILANNLLGFLIFTQAPDVGELYPGGRLSPGAVITSQLPFVIVALLGVGIGVRRNLRQTLVRLGYERLSPAQLGIVAAFIAVALVLAQLADVLFARLQPDLYNTVGELSNNLFSPGDLAPASAVLFAILIGIGAGLGEETLFRGAVQPVLGITLTSVLFASLHVQYGPSLLLGYVFLLSIGLGLLRRHVNTTASLLAHAGFNSLGILLPYFFGI